MIYYSYSIPKRIGWIFERLGPRWLLGKSKSAGRTLRDSSHQPNASCIEVRACICIYYININKYNHMYIIKYNVLPPIILKLLPKYKFSTLIWSLMRWLSFQHNVIPGWPHPVVEARTLCHHWDALPSHHPALSNQHSLLQVGWKSTSMRPPMLQS